MGRDNRGYETSEASGDESNLEGSVDRFNPRCSTQDNDSIAENDKFFGDETM